MIIRKAKLDDIEEITGLWKKLMLHHDNIAKGILKHYQQYDPNSGLFWIKFLKKNIRSSKSLVLVAEDNKKLVGYSLNFIKNNIVIFKIKKLGYISDLYIDEGYRKKGISTKFKSEIFKWFKKKEIKHASLMVHSQNNHAHKIYKKWGFIDYHIELRKKI